MKKNVIIILLLILLSILIWYKCEAQDTTYLITVNTGKQFDLIRKGTLKQADSVLILSFNQYQNFIEIRTDLKNIYVERKIKQKKRK